MPVKSLLKSLSLRAGSAGSCIDPSTPVTLTVNVNAAQQGKNFFSYTAPFDCLCVVHIRDGNSTSFRGFNISTQNVVLAEANRIGTIGGTLVSCGGPIKKGATIKIDGENLNNDSGNYVKLIPTVGSKA